MRSALLRGREHHVLDWTDVIGLDDAAAALSIGGTRKTYLHTDPNEDAAGIGVGPRGSFLAIADAHDGFEASEVLLEYLLANPAPNWTDDEVPLDEAHWRRHALAALTDASDEVTRERAARDGFESESTLTLAVVRPAEDRLWYAAIGDSHLFVVSADGASEIAPCDDRSLFVGRNPIEKLSRGARIGSLALDGIAAVAVVTDGISERGIGLADPAAGVFDAAESARACEAALRSTVFARGIVERANAAQRKQRGGDNVAVAACWVGNAAR